MRKILTFVPLVGAALILGGGQLAQASIVQSFVNYPTCYNTTSNGCTAAPSYVTGDGSGGTIHVVDFNDGTTNDPNGIAHYSAGLGSGGASPANDNTDYLHINSSSVTITFSVAIDYFGFHWGTNDTYNTIDIFDGATQVGHFAGAGGTSDSYVS